MDTREALGLYIHLPFCRTRCAYCDFAILTGHDNRTREFAQGVVRDMEGFVQRYGRRMAGSLYFGGGTPSRVEADIIHILIQAVRDLFFLESGAEVSLEANPEDLNPRKLETWLRSGINRLTLGVQAFDQEGLRAIGRPGNVEDSRQAVRLAREVGVPALGIDLIFGRPGQTLEGWGKELEQLPPLEPAHVSCYALETTSRTPLVRRMERGAVPVPDPDLAAAMYEMAVRKLAAGGWERYEISNFARPGFQSRHNLRYWQDEPFAGFGPAAASYIEGKRWTNPRRLDDYLDGVQTGWRDREEEAYDPDRRVGEALVMGLRTAGGVDLDHLAYCHGEEALRVRRPVLQRAEAAGMLIREGSRIRLTPQAMLIADELFVDLL